MQAFDVLLCPSKYEGLPVTLVEAQTSCLPCVISSNIPSESIVVDDIVSVKTLDEDMNEWIKCIMEQKNIVRENTTSLIKNAGFDINQTSKWLEDFYVSKAK